MKFGQDAFTTGPGTSGGNTGTTKHGSKNIENGKRQDVHTIKANGLHCDAMLRLGKNQYHVVGYQTRAAIR